MLNNDHSHFEQFHIQLKESASQAFQVSGTLRSHVSDNPTLLDDSIWSIRYPRDFVRLRSLTVLHWYIPSESLKWRIHNDLSGMSFNWLNSKQQISLRLMLHSEEACAHFLYETRTLSKRTLFGNVLGNDVKLLDSELKFQKRKPKVPKRTTRRRGYRDHGSRVPAHQWLPKHDYSFTEFQNKLEQRRIIIDKSVSFIIKKLLL